MIFPVKCPLNISFLTVTILFISAKTLKAAMMSLVSSNSMKP